MILLGYEGASQQDTRDLTVIGCGDFEGAQTLNIEIIVGMVLLDWTRHPRGVHSLWKPLAALVQNVASRFMTFQAER